MTRVEKFPWWEIGIRDEISLCIHICMYAIYLSKNQFRDLGYSQEQLLDRMQ